MKEFRKQPPIGSKDILLKTGMMRPYNIKLVRPGAAGQAVSVRKTYLCIYIKVRWYTLDSKKMYCFWVTVSWVERIGIC
jgi:hypothetical protein